MKTTLTRLFTVMMLIMVSMTAGADVKVLYGKSGNDTFTGGKISATQEVQKDGQVAVTFTIKPDNGYTFTYTKTSLVIVSVYDPSSKSSTRADEIKVSETLWPKGTEGSISYPNYGEYTVTVDSNLGVWVQSITFEQKRENGAKNPDYSGKYYIASDAIVSNSSSYDANTPANNYYLCPTEGWCYYLATDNYTGTDNGQPFLTTYKWRDGVNDKKAIWIIEKCPNSNYSNYYYIKQHIEGDRYKYLMLNGQISGTSNKNRMRVHLEELVEDTDNPTRNALFSIASASSPANAKSVIILPKEAEKDSNRDKYLVVNAGNANALTGQSGKGDGPGSTNEQYKWTKGIIGLYRNDDNGKNDITGPFYLENNPTISYPIQNKVRITYFDYADNEVEIRYTTNGETPTANSTLYEGEFDPPAGTTTIKAIAIKDGKESDVATFTPPFFYGSTHKYAIQSVACQFYYLIPNLKTTAADYPKNISTLNVPCSTMAWNFEDAADNDGQYYYIKNSQGGYLYYPTTDNTDKYIFLQQDKDTNDDGYKFSITSHASGGYNLIPKNQTTPINKTSVGSSDTERLRAVKLAGSIGDSPSRWNIIPYDNTTGIPQWTDEPFDESTNSVTHFYKITSVSTSNPIILNNSGLIKIETVPTSDYDERKAMWVIKKVGSDADGLLDYYTFQNAYTGDLLYYNGAGREKTTNASPGVLQIGMPTAEGADATWAHFVIVQTTSGYNIIPRVLVDNTKAIARNSTHEAFNCINRAGGGDWTGTFYDIDNGSRWTFAEQTNVKCMNPVFREETDGSITITSVTNAAVIRYTDNGNDPDANSGVYTTKSNTLAQRVIKAIAIIGTDANTASDVVTLLNKPDITLTEGGNTVTDNTYTYDGTAHTPTIGEVSITQNSVKTMADASAYSIDEYLNNVNAGTPDGTNPPTVKVADADDGDVWYIWNASKTFTIKKAPLTVTANDKTITYGQEATNDGVTYAGFVNNETATVLSGTLGYAYNYSQFGNVGNTYTITPNGLTSDNYEISFVAGILAVEQKEVGLSWTDTSLPYNGLPQKPTATATGTENNDAIGVTVDGAQTTVGTGYIATATELTGLKAVNYKLPVDNTTTFDITKAELTITAKPNTISYGDVPSDNGVTYSGFVDGENIETPGILDGNLSYAFSYHQFDDVGDTYTITPSGQTSEKYEIIYVDGTLTVVQKGVGITWNEPTTFTYNGSEQAPIAAVNAADLVNGDAVGVTVTGAQTDASTEPYTATASGLTGNKAGNYVPATGLTCDFTIEPKPLSSDGIEAEISKTVSGNDVSYPVTVKDGSVALSLTSDYTLDDPVTSGSYTTRDVTGANNYTGTVTVKYANVTFMSNDNADPTEWSATFVADADYDKPSESENITPYIVTAVGSDVVEIQALENVPQGAPLLLLHSAASQPYGFMVRAKDNVSAPTGNLLRVAAEDMTVGTAEMYLLYKCEFVLNMAGTLPEGKVYLPKTTNAGARLMITNDPSTGIASIQTDKQEVIDKWYSLDGRRLNGKPTKKGLYIKNGQKAVVK